LLGKRSAIAPLTAVTSVPDDEGALVDFGSTARAPSSDAPIAVW
jgi:hypothetical protein